MSEYKILRVIGKGAFGDAYLGLHLKERKEYVIKQVDVKNKSLEQKQHIFNEVKLLQQFHHINIVYFRDSFIDNKGLLNIVMEYCQGGDMNQVIETMQGNKIPQDKIIYWLAQIALAIFYLHEKKILHRDLKSPNIFILKGNIRLGDFGISKVLDHVRDLAQTNIGTPYYMSPEQYNHKPYSYKSDIWAFGCILYEMCNQRRPFEANNIQALGMKVVRGNFPPVSECYSKDLRNLISEMLSKNPVKRPNIIQILLKPFVKKRVIEYMKQIYVKKDEISKKTLQSFLQQAKKLGVTLEQKKPIPAVKQVETQRQRSTSLKKSKIEDQKQKQRKQRERKKQQLQNQLRKHNQQRKQMAEKLKKIEEERKALLDKKKSEKNIKAIYEKVQSAGNIDYQSEKYNNKQDAEKKTKKQPTQQSSKNLIGKVLSQVPNQPAQKVQSSSTAADKNHSNSVSINRTVQTRKESTKGTFQKKKPEQPQKIQKAAQVNKALPEQKKAFKMEEQYEMEFEDCQPQNYDLQKFEQDENVQKKKSEKQFDSQLRLPTFANDDQKLAKQVKEIQNLVFVSNQAVEQISKKQQNYIHANQPGNVQKTKQQLVAKQKPKSPTIDKQPSEKVEQKIIVIHNEIEKKVQNLKQQIKMKTQHINSIRNELSNIDFQLSESEDDQFGKVSLHHQANFKKKQFNPQHAKINDRVNMLKESAVTILGGDVYKKFYEYLVTIKEKGRTVKRDYLENVLGRQKIGAYHLVQQIVRLNRMLDKIPKWL